MQEKFLPEEVPLTTMIICYCFGHVLCFILITDNNFIFSHTLYNQATP